MAEVVNFSHDLHASLIQVSHQRLVEFLYVQEAPTLVMDI